MRYGLKGKARTRLRVVKPRSKNGAKHQNLTKRDIALIRTPFDSSRKNKQFIIKKVKIG